MQCISSNKSFTPSSFSSTQTSWGQKLFGAVLSQASQCTTATQQDLIN